MLQEIQSEISLFFKPPHPQLNNILLNAVISFLFFIGSMVIGSVNQKAIPFAATIILLWTLADASLTNQFMFDIHRTRNLKNGHDVRHTLIVRNLAVVVLSIPMCLVFGLVMAVIVGKWSEIVYGLVMALALVWGWMGVTNIMSAYFPFNNLEFKQVLKRVNGWFGFSLLYALPWLLLPLYALIILLPLRLVGLLIDAPPISHMALAGFIVLAISFSLWLLSLRLAGRGYPRIERKVS